MLSRMQRRWSPMVLSAALIAVLAPVLGAQQKIDEEYTRKIKEYLQDPRITTELVDHLPASSTVPTPLKFNGRIVGMPGELTYASQIHKYLKAIADASPRARFYTIGKTEEGRDIVMLAIADEATLRNLDANKRNMDLLADPRKLSEARAKELLKTTKPLYWLTSGMHSTENGGPEMLMELAYRLVVQETDFIKTIRSNVITLITPVLEVDGREKQVDTYYYNKTRAQGEARLNLMYWGKYVAHDNNRDGMGQYLKLTQAVNTTWLDWKPQVLHDLHESATYFYSSTGTGPYNEAIDAITVDEWWTFAKHDVGQLTKRGVPGAWTYGFYDGWTPNYMFFVAHVHNATGRFYEIQSYGPDNYVVNANQSREWYRPNPALDRINWGPRNNTNIQQSGVLFSLHHFATNREHYLENFYIKNKRAIARGTDGPINAWVIPADQHAKQNTAEAVNDMRVQGLEFHRATAAGRFGGVEVKVGDYIVRGDQPYRTIGDMYFSYQAYSPSNPSPYDDTGWTFQLMRNITIREVNDKAILALAMAPVTAPVKAPAGIEGNGNVVIVAANTDNALVSLRWKHKDVKMAAARASFSAGGRQFAAGSFIITGADRAALAATLTSLGLQGVAVTAAPTVATHDLDVPRIGYLHSWTRTQDEGWVRAALDHYGVPYDYFADKKIKDMADLKSRYDVIIYPHVGGNAQALINGVAMSGNTPLPYKKTDKTPNLGVQDSDDDIRGGMGIEGLMNLYKFVQAGGLLITEGANATLFPEFNLTPGVNIETPTGLFARGSVYRGVISDATSPLVYGYVGGQIPVYFSQSPVMSTGGAGGGGRGGNNPLQQNISPMADNLKPRLSPWELPTGRGGAAADSGAGIGAGGRGAAAGGGGRGGFGGFVGGPATVRTVLRFPNNPDDMLLSGTLAGGSALAGRAQLIDAKVGEGHVVMFAIRPFWRWQTQGTYTLGFNALLHWNDLDAR